VLRTQM